MWWHAKTFDEESFAHDEVKAATCRSRMRCRKPRYGTNCAGYPIVATTFRFASYSILSPVCMDAAGYKILKMYLLRRGPERSEGEILSKANTRIPNRTYNVGVHSRMAASSWLYDGPTRATHLRYSTTISDDAWGTC